MWLYVEYHVATMTHWTHQPAGLVPFSSSGSPALQFLIRRGQRYHRPIRRSWNDHQLTGLRFLLSVQAGNQDRRHAGPETLAKLSVETEIRLSWQFRLRYSALALCWEPMGTCIRLPQQIGGCAGTQPTDKKTEAWGS